ncbi:MAG: hypothetical protein F4X20_00135 [Dehalococcoidia bacterium]|nr:hypothetical protein [Dehalococcoidia bacterium]
MTLVRALGSLILGLVVIVGLMYLLVVVNITQRLEDPEVYRAAFTEIDAYNRIYDEVLIDRAVQDETLDLLGGVGLEAQESVEVLRDVMPPAYLQDQIEANIDRFTGFLSSDLERLDLYLELREPLDRVEVVVLDKAEEIITELEIDEPPSATTECTPDSLQSLAGDMASEFAGLSAGELPESVPSLETLDEDCRRQEFDNWIGQVADDPRVDPETARTIEEEKDDLRESFIEGDTTAFLEKAAAPLVGPVIDDSLEELRQGLQNDRLDLLEELADNFDNLTREDIDEQAEFLRDTLGTATGTGGMLALLLVIVGSLLLAATEIPNPTGMLRWPGLYLLLGGAVSLAVGLVLNTVVPGRLVVVVTTSSSGTPTALISLIGDLMESFARQFTAGFIPGTVTVLVIGAVLFVASFFVGRFLSIVRGEASGFQG